MSGPCCDTCVWWARSFEADDGPINQCRKYAPRPKNWDTSTEPGWAEWPQTLPEDFCGEHTPKENAK